MTIQFWVPGVPKGQPRPRAFAFRGHARIYNPGTAENWKSLISDAAKDVIPDQPLDGPLRVDINLYFPRPKAHFRSGKRAHELKDSVPDWHTGKPDRDNADKACLDALTTLGFWKDDAQVCDGMITKRYSNQAGALITITRLV